MTVPTSIHPSIYVCMRVCMCVCMYVCVCVYSYIKVGQSEGTLKDYEEEEEEGGDGQKQRKVFMDFDVCTQLSSTKSTCQALVSGISRVYT